jgi:hypothetical protein
MALKTRKTPRRNKEKDLGERVFQNVVSLLIERGGASAHPIMGGLHAGQVLLVEAEPLLSLPAR